MKRASFAVKRRRVLFAAAAGSLTAAAVAVLHTPAGRPLMARLGMSCPAKRASPAAAEALRQRGVGELRGEAPAPARPALGHNLDRTRAADVEGWAAARGLACQTRQQPSSLITCTNVPLDALWPGRPAGRIDELVFAFAPDGRLICIDSLRRALSGAEASRLFEALARDLAAALGTNGERAGESTAAYLTGGPLRTARLRYRFSDYLATVTATNLPSGVALREQYQSAL
jgi:hypothetical protein